MNKVLTIKITIYVMIAIIFFLVLKKIGLIKIKTKEERKASREKREQKAQKKVVVSTISRSDLFKPEIWKKKPSSTLLSGDDARDKAIEIYKAWGWFNDDEDAVYGTFRSLTHKNQISQLSFFYLSEYGKDLATDIIRHMSKGELNILWNIIDAI